MAMDRLSLGRFLELLQLPLAERLRSIERDARRSLYVERFGKPDGGGDFYGPFWSDAKRSAVEVDFDLPSAIRDRIESNRTRRRLYPILLRGFLEGWGALRASRVATSSLQLVERLSVTLKGKVEDDRVYANNLLAVKESIGLLHIVYPYFSKDVRLGTKHAKLGLGVLKGGLKIAQPDTVAMLDVLRGNLFIGDSWDDDPIEQNEVRERYGLVMRDWREQRRLHG